MLYARWFRGYRKHQKPSQVILNTSLPRVKDWFLLRCAHAHTDRYWNGSHLIHPGYKSDQANGYSDSCCTFLLMSFHTFRDSTNQQSPNSRMVAVQMHQE